jgi:hypothetical protein
VGESRADGSGASDPLGNSPQRQMVIEQLRRLGVRISDDGEVVD